MHEEFRNFGQNMGFQNVRAILPEQIDSCLNSAITQVVNSIYKAHSNKLTDNTHRKANNETTNALRTLLRSFVIEIGNDGFKYEKGFDDKCLSAHFSTGGLTKDINSDVMYYSDFMIVEGFGEFDENGIYQGTNTYERLLPIRFTDADALAESLNDFILQPCASSPILVMYGNENQTGVDDLDVKFDLYLGELIKTDSGKYQLSNHKIPLKVICNYIKTPAIVNLEKQIDCDLPEHLHDSVVKIAVGLYKVAISKNQQTQQQPTE